MGLDQSVGRTPVTGSEVAFRGRESTVAAGLIVAGVVLLSIAIRYAMALDQPAPWLMGDELRYAEMAKSFLEDGRLHFREAYIPFATAYPALIAPAWGAASISTAYEIAKAINVVLMTMSAVVVFFWVRRLAATRYALVGAALVLLMPTFEYTGMLMMENAALPASLLGAFVIARALERPTLAWQLGVFAAIGLAGALRLQLLSLGLVYVTAIVLDAGMARIANDRGLRASLARFTASFGIVAMGALPYVALKVLSGSSLTSGLGAYSFVGESHYDVAGVGRWFVWHAGELALSVGFIPAACFGLLLAAAIRQGKSLTAADRAFVAVVTASTFWFVLQAAAFASRFSQRIEERYMLYAAPLLLIALVVWFSRARPRSAASILVASVVPALLVMTIPFERLFNVGLFGDTFGLIPFMRLTAALQGGIEDVRIAVAGGLVVAVLGLLSIGQSVGRVVFPAAVGLFLVLSGYTVHGTIDEQSTAARGVQRVGDPSWIDDRLGSSAQVGFVYGPSMNANPHLLWQTEFWNRSVRGVYVLGTDRTLSYSDDEIRLDSAGRLVPKASGRPIDETYLLADPSLGIVGDVVATPGQLALIRIDPPARLGSAVDGVFADRWSGPQAGLSQYAPLPGGRRRLRVEVSREGWGGPDVPGRVTISAGPLRMTATGPGIARVTVTREWTVHSGLARTFVLPVPPTPFRAEVRVSPTFSPAQFGQPDTRQLGAQLAFAAG
jgi:hypothetical protein